MLARRRLGWQLYKLGWAFGTACIVIALYFPVGHATAERSVDLMTRLDQAIPFVPWTWWIYFPGYLAGLVFGALALRDERVMEHTCYAMLLLAITSIAVYLVVPSTFPRPADWQGTGLTAEAIYWFWGFDPPNNTFPSTHCGLATLAAIGLWRERNPLWWVSGLSALGVVVTVHTTKQHYWVDALAGVMLAWLMHRLVFDVIPAWRGKPVMYPLRGQPAPEPRIPSQV